MTHRFKAILVFALAFLVFSPAARAQEEDAFGIWNNVTFRKSFGTESRWTAGFMAEYRHQFRAGESKTVQYFVRPSISYKVRPWLRVQYQFDAAFHSSGFQLRFMPEVMFSHKVGLFTFSLRQRILSNWRVEAGTNSTLLRTRARAECVIPKTPLMTFFAVEPYWCEFGSAVENGFQAFQKVRWYAGLNIKVSDYFSIMPQYNCQAYFNHDGRHSRRRYDDHVAYLTFVIKLP